VNNDTSDNGYVGVETVFIQFAGFTFGKSFSAFSSPWHGYPGNNTSFLVGGFDSVTGVNNVQYSRQFGNGVSATIGVDDSSANNVNRTQIINAVGGLAGVNGGVVTGGAGGNIGFSGAASAFITPVGTSYGGTSVPDFVGNVRVDQAWGLFQISGAVHDNHAGYFSNANDVGTTFNNGQNQAGAVNFGHPSDVYGGAVSAALQIKNIPTGTGDDIKTDATWSRGASKYVIGTSGASPSSFDIFNGTSFAMGIVTDAIYSGISPNNGNPQTGLKLTNGWGFRGAFNHNWAPNWSSSLFGGIAGLSYNQTAKTLYCNTYVVNAGVPIKGGGVTKGGGTGWPVQPGNFVVRPRLHDLRNRSRHALDPGQEPDLQRRSAVRLSEDQYVGHDHQRAVLGAAAGPHDL
jgi:hypothetical protein